MKRIYFIYNTNMKGKALYIGKKANCLGRTLQKYTTMDGLTMWLAFQGLSRGKVWSRASTNCTANSRTTEHAKMWF